MCIKFSSSRRDLIEPLTQIVNIIEKRQTIPILANMLISVTGNDLQMRGTDMEIEGLFQLPVESKQSGSMTLPARKLFDICRLLPDDSQLVIEKQDRHVKLTCGRSRFKLNTLPVEQ